MYVRIVGISERSNEMYPADPLTTYTEHFNIQAHIVTHGIDLKICSLFQPRKQLRPPPQSTAYTYKNVQSSDFGAIAARTSPGAKSVDEPVHQASPRAIYSSNTHTQKKAS